MNRTLRLVVAMLVVLVVFVPSPTVDAQDQLATARTLYASAAYEEALTVLDRLKASNPVKESESRGVEEARVLCLVALGREADASKAIETVVSADPFYKPADADIPPRVRAAYQSVRQRLLPSLAQQAYAAGKAAYERKQHEEAVRQLTAAVRLMSDPDLDEASAAVLADLRTLATGFLDLAKAAAAAAAPPPPPPVAAPAPVPPPNLIYEGNPPGLTPPVVIRQDMPAWPSNVVLPAMVRERKGVLEVVINEQGAVESAVMRGSLHPAYDVLVLTAARTWQYRPATKDGRPVKFRKRIGVDVQPR